MNTADNRQRIVDAATHLFGERGYANTSIADIAAHAGFLKGNLAYYFKTKAEVLESVTRARQAERLARIQALLPENASALEAINAFLQMVEDSAPDIARAGCPVGSLCSELGKDDPDLQLHATRMLEALRKWLEIQFVRIETSKRAKDHAEHLLSLMQGAAVMAHAYRDPALVSRRVAAARQWLGENPGFAAVSGNKFRA